MGLETRCIILSCAIAQGTAPTAAGSVPVGREKADATNVGSVGAPMAGAILEVIAKPGASRHPGLEPVC